MKEKILVKKFKHGEVVETVEIGVAVFKNSSCISGRKYNELKRKALKLVKCGRGEYCRMVTESGKVSQIGGYPASEFNVVYFN